MLHNRNTAFAPDIELKDANPDDPASIVTKSLDDLRAAIEARLSSVEAKIALPANDNKAMERLDKLEAKLNRPTSIETPNSPTAERKAFATYLRHGNATPIEELKTLTVSNDEQGGYLAPAEVTSEFIRDLVEFSPVRSVASVRTIASPSIKYPRRTGVTNAQWEGETEDAEESTLTFGQVEIPACKLTTYVDISNELLADSAGTAEAEVNLALAEDFGKKEGVGFVSGTGAKQPEGVMTNAEIGFTAAGFTSTLASDALIALMYALPTAYRNSGTWLMNGTTLAAVRQMQDGQNNYLWQRSFQEGQPETILGRPVIEAIDMPDIASGECPIIFGDFNRAYRIVDRLAMSIMVNPYSLATKGITRIHATRRVGGKVILPAALRKLKMIVS